MNTISHTDSVEVILKDQCRRRWPLLGTATLVRRTYEPGMNVLLVARQQDVAKRDYMACMNKRDARTILEQPPAAFEHFNEVHPH